MFRKLGRLIKEGFFGVVRHSAMSISSASAVTITLCLMSIFFIFSYNVDAITTSIESTVRIAVKVSFDHEESMQIQAIQNQITALEGVAKIEFFSKDQEFEYYVSMSGDDEATKEIFEPYREENPFHHMIYVDMQEGALVQDIATKIAAIDGVFDVNYGGDSALMLVRTMNSIRYGGLILVVALSALTIFLINNTIKLTIFARKKEISIMRSVGATNGYIRAPYVFEGMFIGVLGSIIPVAFTIFGYIYLYDQLGGKWLTSLFPMIYPHPFILWISLILVGIGVFVGLLGSFFSVSRYLRWKR